MTTPSLEALINELIDQRLRQMQTAYPAEVVEYDATNATATIKPLFLEAWRGPDGERISEPFDNEEDTYVENVIVAFPRSGDFRITFPIAAGDTGLVIVTKYSLDRFREGGGQADPGDLAKFAMSGSVFFPCNLTPDGSALDASAGDGDTDVYLGEGGASDYLALKADVDAIKGELDDIATTFSSIVFTVDTGDGTGTTGTIGTPYSNGYTPTYSKNVKVESN